MENAAARTFDRDDCAEIRKTKADGTEDGMMKH